MALRHRMGIWAEENALQWFLSRRKCRLLIRNYRWRGGEIDLVFEETQEKEGLQVISLVFLEVRSRSINTWVSGPESVGFVKQNRLKKTGLHFLAKYRGVAQLVRFDLVWWDGRIWQHLENIF